jgi:hypothetical protein
VARYGGGAKKAVKSAMHRRKSGTLRSGSGKRVRSRKQAIGRSCHLQYAGSSRNSISMSLARKWRSSGSSTS